MRAPIETPSLLLFGANLDPSSCLDSADVVCFKTEDDWSRTKLVTPPVVPSQCCALATSSAADHCRTNCTSHGSRQMYTGYQNLDRALSLISDEVAPFSHESASSQEQQSMSGFSSSPPFSTLTSSSPPSSCLSTSPPASISSALDWNLVASKGELQAFDPQPYHRDYQSHVSRQAVEYSNASDTSQSSSQPAFDVFAEHINIQSALSPSEQAPDASDSSASYANSVERARNSIVCDVPGCNRLFANIYNLNDHRRTHLRPRERPHVCPLHGCPKKYFYRRDLVRHLRKHHSAVDLLPPFPPRSRSHLVRPRARSSD